MLSYLEKFNTLPAEIRLKVSEPTVMQAISELEKQYGVNLASVIMRVMIKEIPILDLSKFFIFEHALERKQAEALVEDLKEKVFFNIKDYLGIISENDEFIDDQATASTQNDSMSSPVQSSGFFFSSEDEEEVKELAQRLKSYKEEKPKPIVDFDKVIDKTKTEAALSFSSEELSTRFKQISITYLKGIRNKIDAKATFTKDIANGGMGMKQIFADNIIALLDSNRSYFEKQAQVEFENNPIASASTEPAKDKMEIGLGQARDMDYDFKALEAKGTDNNISEDVPKPPISFKLDDIEKVNQEVQKNKLLNKTGDRPQLESTLQPTAKEAPASVAEKSDSQIPVNLGNKPQQVQTVAQAKPVPVKDAKITLHREAGQGKVKMDDVKFVPKLTGPIDELKEMNLLNFRRLATDPDEAANKMKEKLDFLEDEGYSQRLKGIEAWRLSPLNKMYLRIGNESITKGQSVEEIINSMKAESEEAINKDEFDAVMQLNKDLRF